MKRFKVSVFSVDRSQESKDLQFDTFVEALDTEDAVRKAKEKQKVEKPELNPADNWAWSAYETAEK
jgi:hypothetical protein